MNDPNLKPPSSEPEAKLRHEFVGMMFAITIGEVGLQAAALVQAGHWAHFLPAYSHLFLATVVVATSWVGWSLSAAPGARRDVQGVFKGEFFVLLLDVALVIVYFILVRTIDFGKEATPPRIEPASTVAFLILVIFGLYFVWDILTKVIISWRGREKSKKKFREHFDRAWWRSVGSRMLPTGICLLLALLIWCLVRRADPPHYLTADLSLFCLVLLFRALKELVSALYRSPEDKAATGAARAISKKLAIVLSAVFSSIMLLGMLWTACSLLLPTKIVTAIETPLPETGQPCLPPVVPSRTAQPGR